MELTKEEKKRLEDFFKERDPNFDTVNTECYKPEVYFQNIDPSENKLDPDKVKKLLKWKYPRFLSDPTKKGKPNENVKKVLENIEKINKFRKKELTEEEFENKNRRIFNSGDVYNIFIKHIARPLEYPIYDTHVLNAFLRLTLGYPMQDLYNGYKKFFFALYEAVFGKDEPKTVERMKEVDSALFNYDKEKEKQEKEKQKNPTQGG